MGRKVKGLPIPYPNLSLSTLTYEKKKRAIERTYSSAHCVKHSYPYHVPYVNWYSSPIQQTIRARFTSPTYFTVVSIPPKVPPATEVDLRREVKAGSRYRHKTGVRDFCACMSGIASVPFFIVVSPPHFFFFLLPSGNAIVFFR